MDKIYPYMAKFAYIVSMAMLVLGAIMAVTMLFGGHS